MTIPPTLSALVNGRALIQNRVADLLFKMNGLGPVAGDQSYGQTLFSTSILEVVGTNMRNLRMVRAGRKDSKVHIIYEQRLS